MASLPWMVNIMRTPASNNLDLTRGYTIALISAAFLSTTAILIRHLTQTYHIPALVLAFWRDSFVALTLLLILRLLRPVLLRVNRRDLSYLVIYGFVLAIFNSLWTTSVVLNGAAVSTVLAYCSAGFTALLGWWFLKERLDWARLLAVALSLGGCVLVSGALDPAVWRSNLIGLLTGIISGLCYAIYTLLGRSAAQRQLNPWTTILYTFGFAAVFLLFFNLIPIKPFPGTASRPADLLWLGTALAGWGVLFLLAAVPTLAGFGLYNMSLGYLPSSVANLIVTLEPAFTAALAYILFGERLSGIQIVGSVMILTGVVFLRIYEGWLASRIQVESQGSIKVAATE
jgi:drug/metabolite transporter (DMT)-like permease